MILTKVALLVSGRAFFGIGNEPDFHAPASALARLVRRVDHGRWLTPFGFGALATRDPVEVGCQNVST